MTSLKELKARLAPGLVFQCHHPDRPYGLRTVVEVQKGGLWYTRPDSPRTHYLRFPQQRRVRFAGETVTVLGEDGRPRFVFTFPRS